MKSKDSTNVDNSDSFNWFLSHVLCAAFVGIPGNHIILNLTYNNL